ncbi:hypothetical protein Tco_0843819 [Tanacetum coccineum]
MPELPTNTVVVYDVPGHGSCVHTHDHGRSEAPDGLPDSILSSEPKPLGKHRPLPPSNFLFESPSLSTISKLTRYEPYRLAMIYETTSASPSKAYKPCGLAVELSPISYLEPRVDKHKLLRGAARNFGNIIVNRWCCHGFGVGHPDGVVMVIGTCGGDEHV